MEESGSGKRQITEQLVEKSFEYRSEEGIESSTKGLAQSLPR